MVVSCTILESRDVKMAKLKKSKEAYEPILSIVSGSFIDNENLDFSLNIKFDESTLYRFRYWENLDTDELSVKWVDRKMKGKTRGFGVVPRKLKSVEQDFYGVERKKEPRNVEEQTEFRSKKAETKFVYPISNVDSILLALRQLTFGSEDKGFHVIDHVLGHYPDIHEDFEENFKKALDDDQVIAESTIFKVVGKILEFVLSSETYTGLALFDSAYNHVLLNYTYKEAYKGGRNLSVDLRDILTTLRAIFQKCDIESAKWLRSSDGWWKYVRLTDMDIPYTKSQKPKFTFADLFAGIGSFRKALERSRGECVFTNEILEQSMYTYSENFNIKPGELNLNYLETFVYQSGMKDIPQIDCLVAGFPCKSFSSLGQRQRRGSGKIALALTDPAFGLLIFDTMKIIKERKPKFFILENVHQFVTDEKVWKNTILRAMTDPTFKPTDVKGGENFDQDLPPGKGYDEVIGKNEKGESITEYVVGQEDIESRFVNLDGEYDVYVRVLNSAGYSSQARIRAFIIGIRKDLNVDFDYGLLPYIRTKEDKRLIERYTKLRAFDSKTAMSITYTSDEYLQSFQEIDMHSNLEKAEIPYTLPLGRNDEFSIVNPKYNLSLKLQVTNLYKLLKAQKRDVIKPHFYNEDTKKWMGLTQINADRKLQKSILTQAKDLYGKGVDQAHIVRPEDNDQFGTLVAGCGEQKNVLYTCPLSGENVYRHITPREAVRVMTFDREPSARMYLPIADTGAYTLAGYSIVTKLLEEITIYLVANVLYNKDSKQD